MASSTLPYAVVVVVVVVVLVALLLLSFWFCGICSRCDDDASTICNGSPAFTDCGSPRPSPGPSPCPGSSPCSRSVCCIATASTNDNCCRLMNAKADDDDDDDEEETAPPVIYVIPVIWCCCDVYPLGWVYPIIDWERWVWVAGLPIRCVVSRGVGWGGSYGGENVSWSWPTLDCMDSEPEHSSPASKNWVPPPPWPWVFPEAGIWEGADAWTLFDGGWCVYASALTPPTPIPPAVLLIPIPPADCRVTKAMRGG